MSINQDHIGDANKMVSSIEFLWDQLKPFLPKSYTVDESVKILSILKQAKEMHKEEIENAHYQGQSDEKEYWNIGDKCMNRFQRNCREYYNETFGE